MGAQGRSRGSLEHEVLACLGASNEPLSVQQVLDDVDPGLAYTTVMTTLSRLHAKNAVARRLSGRAYQYSLPGGPDAARASMTARSMHRLLQAGNDHRGVLTKFVAELSPDDEALLRRMLESAAPLPRRRGTSRR